MYKNTVTHAHITSSDNKSMILKGFPGLDLLPLNFYTVHGNGHDAVPFGVMHPNSRPSGATAAQPICNRQVGGSIPFSGSIP